MNSISAGCSEHASQGRGDRIRPVQERTGRRSENTGVKSNTVDYYSVDICPAYSEYYLIQGYIIGISVLFLPIGFLWTFSIAVHSQVKTFKLRLYRKVEISRKQCCPDVTSQHSLFFPLPEPAGETTFYKLETLCLLRGSARLHTIYPDRMH